MKIIKEETINEKQKRFSANNKIMTEFKNHTTKFWVSLIILFFQVIAPWLILFFLTSPEINFRITNINVGIAAGIGMGLLVVIFLVTTITYFLNLHFADQYTTNFAFSGLIFGLYLAGFWWTKTEMLYQIFVMFAFIIVFLFIGAVFAIYIKNFRLYLQERKYKNSGHKNELIIFKPPLDQTN